MIISDATSSLSNKKKIRLITAIVLGLILLYLFAPASLFQFDAAPTDSYYCDMETVNGKFFVSSGQQFTGGKTQNGDYSRSGKYSCFLSVSNGNRYGAGIKFSNFKPGETYKASIWRFREKGGDDGHLVVSDKEASLLYKGTRTTIKTVGGWDLLEINFRIPVYTKLSEISVYAFSEGKYPVYFDDLLVQKTREAPVIATEDWKPELLKIDIKKSGIKKLNQKRTQALRNGILESAEDDWVKAKITTQESNETVKAEVRLKGDWLDHIETDKWSFRVKTKSGMALNRLRYFSIHTPKARAFLQEWILHQLFEQEDILTTYYDFLTVELNNKQKGVYAIEEHFDKVLLERQKRREGPIVRFSEDGYWEGIKRHLQLLEAIDHDIQLSIKQPSASTVTPFQQNKTVKTDLLKEQFEQAAQLMDQYKRGAIQADAIFDLDKMARYFAICEALGAYHGITWHNQRFYYNPVTSKLEPIGYDGFAEKTIRKNNLIGAGALNGQSIQSENIEQFLFLDVEFTKLYAKYVLEYTSRSFLDDFFATIEEDLKAREVLIQTEFEDYKFEKDQLIVNALRLNSMVLPFNDYSLKVYAQDVSKNKQQLKIGSYHSLPLVLIGAGPDALTMTDTFAQKALLESFYHRSLHTKMEKGKPLKLTHHDAKSAYDRQQPISYLDLTVDQDIEFLFYKPLGIDSVFYTGILDWPLRDGLTTQQAIFNDITLVSNDIYTVADEVVFFKAGKHKVRKPIVIPAGYRVVFEAGCELDFVSRAKFISKSPVSIKGREDARVIIRSSDKSAQGFTVLQAPETSVLHYAEFDQFNTLDERGWSLTGAVTFYESDVEIDHCIFKNNVCEDGLNIVRSAFSLETSLISNTFSDGFDADFCKGTVKKVRFLNTGNDGMDFSGSVILITSAEVENAGDKGVSVGEDTDASINKISIKNSNIAVAAKDLSTLFIEFIDMEDCNQGFAAYQKKPEFGGAHIVVNQYEASNVKRLHNIRVDCSLQLVDKITKGEALGFGN